MSHQPNQSHTPANPRPTAQNIPCDDRSAARARVGEEEVEVRKQGAEGGVALVDVLVAEEAAGQLLQLYFVSGVGGGVWFKR